MFMVVWFLVVGLVGGVFEDEGVVRVDEVLCEDFVDFVCVGSVAGGLGGIVHVFCEDMCEGFDCSLGGGVDVDVGGVAVECDGNVFHWCCLSCLVLGLIVPYVVVFVVCGCVLGREVYFFFGGGGSEV